MQTQSVLNLVSWETQQSAATAIKELETSRLSTFLFPPTHPSTPPHFAACSSAEAAL